jgi:hypothetical protein
VFHFQENDSAGVRVLIGAFIDTYNAYRRLMQDTGLDNVLADLNLRAQALKEIGECDDSFVQMVKEKLRAFDQNSADLGRTLMLAIQFMNKKRGAEISADKLAEEWPDVISGGESEN